MLEGEEPLIRVSAHVRPQPGRPCAGLLGSFPTVSTWRCKVDSAWSPSVFLDGISLAVVIL